MLGHSYRWLSRAVIALLLLGLPIALSLSDWLTSWDSVIYDWQLKLGARPPPTDVVIVAIDEASLNEIGRWPWSRRVHAEFIDTLTALGAKAVGVDILFAEPDDRDPQSDVLLARAIKNNGRVVLPVVQEQLRLGGQLLESMPIPQITEVAAGLGHVDVDLDRDGIARGIYLKAGMGDAHWSSFSLALAEVVAGGHWTHLPGRRNPALGEGNAQNWVRDYHIGVSFLGPPGHFPRLSYVNVLRGQVPAETIRGKIVLVGATAAGMDELPTPLAGHSYPMPGVEFLANGLETLRQGLEIQPLSTPWRLALTLVLVLVPTVWFWFLPPRWVLFATVAALALSLLGSVALMQSLRLWFPPFAAILTVTLAYVLWSWNRLESLLRYLNQELLRLNAEPMLLQRLESPELSDAMSFIRHVLPVAGAALYDGQGRALQRWGVVPANPPVPIGKLEDAASAGWLRHDNSLSTMLPREDGDWWLEVAWNAPGQPTAEQTALLNELAQSYSSKADARSRNPLELIQTRIQQVQRAIERLRSLRSFITDSLAQMADGVIVADGLGRVLLANGKAATYLLGNPKQDLTGMTLGELLAQVEFPGAGSWRHMVSKVLTERHTEQTAVRTLSQHDILVQMGPFADIDHAIAGVIVTLADISPLKASERRRAEMLSFVSHDLRSPLASVIALAQLAEYRPARHPPAETIVQIKERVQKTLELADSFLQLARAESNEQPPLNEVDLVFIAESSIAQVKPQADAKDIAIVAEHALSEAWIWGNGSLLERALVNLLTNAIKYSPAGARVTVGLESGKNEACCWIQDTGYGIAPEDIPKLFNRFHRIQRKETEHEQGAGLGLVFVKTVVDRHHGRLEVQSKLGEGTRFSVYFPIPSRAASADAGDLDLIPVEPEARRADQLP
ncbi:MAG: CHASE2 domain-containing protein [Gammaproteobacteria bacterium]